jgi:mono/diheme cytochrome c family protein
MVHPLHDSRAFVAMLAVIGLAAMCIPSHRVRAQDDPVADPEPSEGEASGNGAGDAAPPAGEAPPKPAAPKPPPKTKTTKKSTPAKTDTMPTKRAPDREAGRTLWLQSCWQCHGETGRGDGPAAAALVGGVPSLEGKLRPSEWDVAVEIIESGRGRMPAYREDIDKHDARRILVYLEDALQGRTGAGDQGDDGDDGDDNNAN